MRGWLPLVHPQMGFWPTTQACALAGNRTDNLSFTGLCSYPLSHTSHSFFCVILKQNPDIHTTSPQYSSDSRFPSDPRACLSEAAVGWLAACPVSFAARALLVHGTAHARDCASSFPLICYPPCQENVNCPCFLLFLGNGVVGPFPLCVQQVWCSVLSVDGWFSSTECLLLKAAFCRAVRSMRHFEMHLFPTLGDWQLVRLLVVVTVNN